VEVVERAAGRGRFGRYREESVIEAEGEVANAAWRRGKRGMVYGWVSDECAKGRRHEDGTRRHETAREVEDGGVAKGDGMKHRFGCAAYICGATASIGIA
jgi:hypothetical protein